MFNAQAPWRVVRFGAQTCVVVDDALTDPHALRALAKRHWAAFEDQPHNAFPGPELALPDGATATWMAAMRQHTNATLGLTSVVSAHARLSVVSYPADRLSPVQRLCHRDRLQASPKQAVVAGVLYLFDDPSLGGTNFFQPRQPDQIDAQMDRVAHMQTAEFDAVTGWTPAYLTESNGWFERVGVVPARFNRLIWYDGSQFHGSHIDEPHRLVADPGLGRLTLNVFAVCEPA